MRYLHTEKFKFFFGEGAQPLSKTPSPRNPLRWRLWRLDSAPLARPRRLQRLSPTVPSLQKNSAGAHDG